MSSANYNILPVTPSSKSLMYTKNKIAGGPLMVLSVVNAWCCWWSMYGVAGGPLMVLLVVHLWCCWWYTYGVAGGPLMVLLVVHVCCCFRSTFGVVRNPCYDECLSCGAVDATLVTLFAPTVVCCSWRTYSVPIATFEVVGGQDIRCVVSSSVMG